MSFLGSVFKTTIKGIKRSAPKIIKGLKRNLPKIIKGVKRGAGKVATKIKEGAKSLFEGLKKLIRGKKPSGVGKETVIKKAGKVKPKVTPKPKPKPKPEPKGKPKIKMTEKERVKRIKKLLDDGLSQKNFDEYSKLINMA